MGYELTVVAALVPADDVTAWRTLNSFSEKASVSEERFSTFFDRLEAWHPCPSTLNKEEAQLAIWKDFPLRSTVSGEVANLSINLPYALEGLPFVIARASELGMTVFDWSSHHIYRADGFPGVKLDVDGQPTLNSPNLDQVLAAIDVLTPKGGPGFLILSGPAMTTLKSQAAWASTLSNGENIKAQATLIGWQVKSM